MLNKLAYKVFEDNVGGLHLLVFEDANSDGNEKVIYSHTGYERAEGQLQNAIKDLESGAHPNDWDGCQDDPGGDYAYLANSEYGAKVVAACDYHGSSEVYPDMMGLNAKWEFDV